MTAPDNQARRAWAADYRAMGTAELLAERDVLSYELADADSYDSVSGDVVRYLSGERLRLADAELARRHTHFAVGADVADPGADEYNKWTQLAREIREGADLVAILRLAGCDLRPAGREWAGPCLGCGGTDRLRVWPASDGRPGRWWCRRCGISGDAISAYRSWVVPESTFFEATRTLAAMLNLRTPDWGSRSRAPGWTPQPVRGGGRRG